MLEKIREHIEILDRTTISQIKAQLSDIFLDIRKEKSRIYSFDGSAKVTTEYGVFLKENANEIILDAKAKMLNSISFYFPNLTLSDTEYYASLMIKEMISKQLNLRNKKASFVYKSDKTKKALINSLYGFLGGFFLPLIIIGASFNIMSDSLIFISIGIGIFFGIVSYFATIKE
jgi:hypothetical protein